MEETAKKPEKTEKVQKKSFFKGLKSEFKKINWPTKESLTKQTVTVVIVAIILGAIISVIDLGLKYGIDKILQIG